MSVHPPSSIPFLALGAWVLTVGWFGFNVMSAQTIDKISGLVAINSLMAMAGGTLAALAAGRNDPGFVHNGPLAGLVAICAGFRPDAPDRRARHRRRGRRAVRLPVHADAEPLEYRRCPRRVSAARPVRRLGRHCSRHLRRQALDGLGGVSFAEQLIGTAIGVGVALIGGFIVYGALKKIVGLRLTPEEEYNGADLSIHKIGATPDREVQW